MDKLKFMEALGNIDSDLIREADTVPAKKPMIQRSIKFAGGIAAAAVLAVGAGVYLHAQKPETAPFHSSNRWQMRCRKREPA